MSNQVVIPPSSLHRRVEPHVLRLGGGAGQEDHVVFLQPVRVLEVGVAGPAAPGFACLPAGAGGRARLSALAVCRRSASISAT